jgi:hypothetical protein
MVFSMDLFVSKLNFLPGSLAILRQYDLFMIVLHENVAIMAFIFSRHTFSEGVIREQSFNV